MTDPEKKPVTDKPTPTKKEGPKHTEELLDEALEESFPASDPPSIPVPKKKN